MVSVEKQGIGNACLVWFGFRPTDDELINHHLTRKLRGLDKDVRVIPELNIYLFEKYDAMSNYLSDGRECFFYCTREGKNRKTRSGFWKETRSKRTFRGCDGEEIGSKRIFAYHKDRKSYGKKSQFSMHEYHLNCCTNPTIGPDQGPVMEYVLCHIINKKVKKINSDSPSECLEPDLVTPGCTAANQGDKDNKAIPQHNLTEAEAGGHGDCSEKKLLQYYESICCEEHQFPYNDQFDGPVNYRDYGPDECVFISELWDLPCGSFVLLLLSWGLSVSDMGDSGFASLYDCCKHVCFYHSIKLIEGLRLE